MAVWRQGTVRAIERIACPLDADAVVLDHLVRLGCNPSEPRECRHYLYVPGELGARTVSYALTRDGWDADCEDVGDAWLVTASIVCGLTSESVRNTRGQLETLARDFGGYYDGWEAAAD